MYSGLPPNPTVHSASSCLHSHCSCSASNAWTALTCRGIGYVPPAQLPVCAHIRGDDMFTGHLVWATHVASGPGVQQKPTAVCILGRSNFHCPHSAGDRGRRVVLSAAGCVQANVLVRRSGVGPGAYRRCCIGACRRRSRGCHLVVHGGLAQGVNLQMSGGVVLVEHVRMVAPCRGSHV